MTKKKGIASKLFIGLTGLTLLSCCFLGTTFARYTSGGSGTAEVGVALWDVDFEGAYTMETEIAQLSPSKDNYNYTVAGTERTNSTGELTVIVITNNSEVDANVTVKWTENPSYTFISGGGFDSGFENNGYEAVRAPAESEVNDLFSISVKATGVDDPLDNGQVIPLATDASVTISLEIVWESKDEVGEVYADAFDTWVGQWVESLTYGLTFTAVQASELP